MKHGRPALGSYGVWSSVRRGRKIQVIERRGGGTFEGGAMRAHVGDMVMIRGHSVGRPERRGRIREVRGDEGTGPFVIEWDDAEGEHLFWPGSDAEIVPPGPADER
jgi:hypothetical protein